MKGKTIKRLKTLKILKESCIVCFMVLLTSILCVLCFEYAFYTFSLAYIKMNYVLTEEQENNIIPFPKYILEKYSWK